MRKIGLIIISGIILFSCEETVLNLPEGNLVGFTTVNWLSNGFSETNNTVTVTITNGDGEWTTKTDENGRFEFTELATGTYNIRYEKPGFGTHHLYGFSFVGGGATNYVSPVILFELYDIEFGDLSYELEESPFSGYYLTVFGNYTAKNDASEDCRLVYYLGKNVETSYSNYKYSNHIVTRQGEFTIYLNLDERVFKSGDKVYIKFYPQVYNSYTYFDINTGANINSSTSLDTYAHLEVTLP